MGRVVRTIPFACIPPDVKASGYCAVCGVELVRSESGWVCPRGLDHTKIITDSGLAEQLELRLPYKRPEAMTPHQWGWYRRRRLDWALRVMNELQRRKAASRVGGGSGRYRVKGV